MAQLILYPVDVSKQVLDEWPQLILYPVDVSKQVLDEWL